MAAAKHNTNAQKWTAEIVWSYLEQIELAARDRNNLFLGQVLERLGLYRDVWRYWGRKFEADEAIVELMELVEQWFEANVFRAGMEERIPARLAILCLKNIYRWREYATDTVVVKMPTPRGVEEWEYGLKRA